MWGHLDPLHPGIGWEPEIPRLHVSACVRMGFTFSNDLTALLTEQQFVAIKYDDLHKRSSKPLIEGEKVRYVPLQAVIRISIL